MSLDITNILDGWPFEPGQVGGARSGYGCAGRPVHEARSRARFGDASPGVGMGVPEAGQSRCAELQPLGVLELFEKHRHALRVVAGERGQTLA